MESKVLALIRYHRHLTRAVRRGFPATPEGVESHRRDVRFRWLQRKAKRHIPTQEEIAARHAAREQLVQIADQARIAALYQSTAQYNPYGYGIAQAASPLVRGLLGGIVGFSRWR